MNIHPKAVANRITMQEGVAKEFGLFRFCFGLSKYDRLFQVPNICLKASTAGHRMKRIPKLSHQYKEEEINYITESNVFTCVVVQK